MYVKDLGIGDIVTTTDDNCVLRPYVFSPAGANNLNSDDIAEARKNGFTLGYVRHFRNTEKKEHFIYLGSIRTTSAVMGLFKHHLFLTSMGTVGLDGYDFRFLTKL